MTGPVFAFGKMPALGDFFRLGAPQGFVAQWDDWVQRLLLTGQERLGAGWSQCYLSAPIWRFTLGPGTVGSRGMMGVFMPSVDKVGRQYPLTLCVPCAGDPVALHFGNGAFYTQMEDLALACLEDEMTRDHLQDSLSAMAVPSLPHLTHGAGQGVGWAMAADLDSLQAGLLCRAMAKTVAKTAVNTGAKTAAKTGPCLAGPVTLWTANLASGARHIRFDDLPSAPRALGLFDLKSPIWETDTGTE